MNDFWGYQKCDHTIIFSNFQGSHSWSVGLLYMEHLSVDFWSKATFIIGCDKSYDIRIIDDIIVRCQ